VAHRVTIHLFDPSAFRTSPAKQIRQDSGG
jgi:hypothetical protein